jgi:hypothetical protein
LEANGAGRQGIVKRWTRIIGWLVALIFPPTLFAQIQIGDNTHLSGGGLATVGYAGSYGNQIQSSHGLNFGFSGGFDGYYYNPNFLNFNITPYYNQSRADSNYQSLTDASGIAASANLFTGSRFPGSIDYRYDYNSTGTLGLPGTPNFTTQGKGQGFGINWSALFPDWPTLSVGYQHGSGSGTLYGTNQETSSNQNMFNVHSTYRLEGFNLNAYYNHNNFQGNIPEFLSGVGNTVSESSGYSTGISAGRNIPFWNGSFYANYSHSSYSTDYLASAEQTSTNSGYVADVETAGANFHPTDKLGWYVNENYTNNLSSYFIQGVGGVPLPGYIPNLGAGSYSLTAGGGVNYSFSRELNASAQATHYSQSYFGQTYTGTFISGNVNYGRKLLDMFTFSAGVVDSTTGRGDNNLGFVGTVNYFHRFGPWETSGAFSYAQNVQSVLVTDTTSYYSYSGNLHRRFSPRVQWTASCNGSHSALSDNSHGASNSTGFSSSLSLRSLAFSANYISGSGNSLLTSSGISPLPPLPGETPSNAIAYNAKSYGGSISWTPIRRMVLTGTYDRSFSKTLSNGIFSRNNTGIFYSQLQYRLRRIGLLAGYTRFTQGISATGVPPGTVNSYYGGISRWFDFF